MASAKAILKHYKSSSLITKTPCDGSKFFLKANLVFVYYQEILLFNMREEPVLFVERDGDYVPYTIKAKHALNEYVVTGKLVKEADHFEANIRKEVGWLILCSEYLCLGQMCC